MDDGIANTWFESQPHVPSEVRAELMGAARPMFDTLLAFSENGKRLVYQTANLNIYHVIKMIMADSSGQRFTAIIDTSGRPVMEITQLGGTSIKPHDPYRENVETFKAWVCNAAQRSAKSPGFGNAA